MTSLSFSLYITRTFGFNEKKLSETIGIFQFTNRNKNVSAVAYQE